MGNNFVDYSNATAIVTKIGQKIAALQGAFIYKGSVAFSGLPATLTAQMNGYVYNLNEDFTTDARFVEGAGKTYSAGTNVCVVDTDGAGTMKFDVPASFVDVAGLEDEIADVLANFAPEFDAADSYAEGDFVTYQNALYRFNAAHSAGAWTGTDVDSKTVATLVAALETSISVVDGKATAAGAAAAAAQADVDALETRVDGVEDRIDTVATDLADEFDETQAYSAGDYVIYEDVLYKFKQSHAAGTFVPAEADAVKVTDLIEAAEPDSLTAAQEAALLALLD